VLLLDVGSEMTNFVITDGDWPLMARFIPGGLGDFVAAVAADLTSEEAEKQALSPRVGLGHDQCGPDQGMPEDHFDPALVYDVRRGLESAAQALVEDVQNSIDHHHTQPRTRDASRVLVSGEGALISGIDGYLGELLGIASGRGKPVQRLSANHSNVSDE
jgi:Tfp pilus assembly PilM family ATPase